MTSYVATTSMLSNIQSRGSWEHPNNVNNESCLICNSSPNPSLPSCFAQNGPQGLLQCRYIRSFLFQCAEGSQHSIAEQEVL